MALSKALGVMARRCVALVDGGASCSAAMETGMHVVVIPNEYTAFQDYGGADIVADEDQAIPFKDIVALLHPRQFHS